MKINSTSILSIATIFVIAFLLIWNGKDEPRQSPVLPANSEDAPLEDSLEFTSIGIPERTLLSNAADYSFVDMLDSNISIPREHVTMNIGDESFALSDFRISGLINSGNLEAKWETAAPSSSDGYYVRTSLSNSITGDSNSFAIAYRPAIRLSLVDSFGMSVPDGAQLNYCILDPDIYQDALSIASISKAETLWPAGSVRRILQVYKGIAPLPEQHSIKHSAAVGHYLLERSGQLICWVTAPGYSLARAETILAAGEISDVEIRLPRRPTVSGYLKQVDGSPVPNGRVIVTVSFGDDKTPDFAFADSEKGSSMGAGGDAGSLRRNTRTIAWTDSEGYFSKVVPRGEFYAASIALNDSYGFSRTEVPDDGIIEQIHLGIDLVNASGASEEHAFLVIDDEGTPVPGVWVNVVIVGDYDWMRQFPTVKTNENGVAHYPWIGEGTNIHPLVLRDPEDLGSNIAPTEYFIVKGKRTTLQIKAPSEGKK